MDGDGDEEMELTDAEKRWITKFAAKYGYSQAGFERGEMVLRTVKPLRPEIDPYNAKRMLEQY